MPQLPAALVESLRLRQVVLVAGGRCSALAGLPAWGELASRLLDRVEDPARKDEARGLLDGRPVAALARLSETLPAEVVAETARAAFPSGRELPAAIAAAARVPWRGVITTALDDLWVRALGPDERGPVTALLPGEALALDGFRGRFLLQLFGRADAPGTLCFAPRDLRAGLGATAALLAEAHRRWSFLFVGFEPGDPDLALLATRLLGASASTMEHFLLLSGATADAAAVAGAELALTGVPLAGGTAEALDAIVEAWNEVASAARPPEDDIDAWIELWTRDPADTAAGAVLERAAARLRSERKWEKLVELLVHRAELVTDKADQVASLREVGRVFDEELDTPERAYSVLLTALRLAPSDEKLLEELKRVARRANLWHDFLTEYGGFIEEIQDPSDSSRHVLEMGRIYLEEVGRRDQAISSFEKALAFDPDSAEALAALEGLYRQAARWRDLARVLAERERRASEPAEARRLRKERATLLLEKLDDAAGAVAALDAVVADDPADRSALRALERLHREAGRESELLAARERLLPLAETDEDRAPLLEALARAYEVRERWADLAGVLDRWAEVKAEPQARAELLARAARLHAEKLGDAAAAEARYTRTLEHDPQHPEALAALGGFCRARGDFLRAAKFLLDAAERTRHPLEKAQRLHEAAALTEERLEDGAKAAELYGRALEVDPEHLPSGTRLALLHEKAERWAELEPLLDLLVRKADPADAGTAELHRRLAASARRLGKADKALKSLEAARALTPEALPVLRALAELQREREAWAEARGLYETIGRLAGEALSKGERIELCERLAQCAAKVGEPDAALRALEEAVTLDPPPDDEVRLWETLGDLQLEQRHQPEEAIRAYQAVLEIQPQRRPILHKLLGLHTEQKQWAEAVATLDKLAELEPTPALRAKYLYASAVIHRDELERPDLAVELLNRALDDQPEMLKAFDAIERLLADRADWKGLARSYRKMIKRLPAEGQNEVRARLWHGLGTVSLAHLQDREAAALALEVAASLDPADVGRLETLAELYVQMGPSALDKAILQHQRLLERQPDRVESYLALAALFQQTQAYDKLWCAAGALTYLGKADHYLQQFWDRHRMSEVPVAAGKLTQELWQKVVHPSEDPLIGALFGLLAPALALTTAQLHQAAGIRRGDKVDINRDDWFPAVALRYVSATLDLAPPDVFVREKDPHTVVIYNLREKAVLTPALVVGQAFQHWSTQHEVVFDLAKRAAFLRWERYPRFALMTPAALDIAVRAGLALGGAPVGSGPHNGEVEKARSKLAQMVPQPVSDQLAVIARRYQEARGEALDIPAWIAAADLSATRAAFVLSTDLRAALRVLQAEPPGLSPLPMASRISDLIAYSVSDEFFTVRQALGLQVV